MNVSSKETGMNQSLSRIDYRNLAIIIIAIVAADTFLKIVLYNLLDFERRYRLIGNSVYIFVTLNKSYGGAIPRLLLDTAKNPISTAFFGSLIPFPVAAYMISAKYIRIRLIWKILIFTGILLVCSYIAASLQVAFPGFTPGQFFVSWFSKIGALCMVFAYFHFSERKIPKYIWCVIFAAGLSNLLSHFYPPFRVIDYIYFRFRRELPWIGISNLADIIFDITILAATIYIISIPIRKIFEIRKQVHRHA